MGGAEREGESWLKEPEELRGMILSKRKNPESPSNAREIRKAKNSEIREKLTKTLEQNVEAEMRRAEGKRKSGLGKAEALEMLACRTLGREKTRRHGESEDKSTFEKANQAEKKGGQT